MKNRFISILLSLAMIPASAVIPAAAATTPTAPSSASADSEASAASVGAVTLNGADSLNFSTQNYTRWSTTMKSYLHQKSDGSLERVEYLSNDSKLIYEVYSSDGSTLKKSGTVNMELDIFGGFFSGSDYNYVVFGKKNTAHSDTAEVLRFVKYSKDWNKLGSVSVKGANTAIPFDAGSLRMTEKNGILYVHTCHGMYSGHQANMTYSINESDMTVKESNYETTNFKWTGYVSHSFNQFIREDGTYLYKVDHGDAHPRAVTLSKSSLSGSFKTITGAEPISLANTGSVGNNDTGVSVGGFELASDKCIIAFNGVDFTKANADPYGKRNIYLSITNKDLSSSKNVKITNYSDSSKISVSTPQLVKVNNTRFLLLWTEVDSDKRSAVTKICAVNDNGTVDSQGIVSTNYMLSDCQPILCKDGMVRWYTSIANAPMLYTVDPTGLAQSASSASQSYDIEIPVTLELGDTFTVPKSVTSNSRGSGMSGMGGFYNCLSGNTVTANSVCSGTLYYFMNYGGQITYSFNIVEPLPKPGAVTVTLKNNASSMTASWNSVDLAKSYIVYYRLSSENTWSQFTTTATSVTIPHTEAGKAYAVQVQSIGENGGKGEYSAVKSLTYIPQTKPVITLVNKTNGIRVDWKAISGATNYAVYYKKTSDSSWTTVKTANIYYTLTNLTAAAGYSVKVRPIFGSSYGLYSAAKALTYIPQIKTTVTLANKTNGIRASWTAVTDAAKYIVEYKLKTDAAWTAKETTNLYYTFTGLTAGTGYSVRVKPVFGTVNGVYSATKSLTYIPQVQPKVTLANKTNGIRADWKTVSGATKYVVYYKTADASAWTSTETTNIYYLFTDLTAGTKYNVQIKPVFGSANGLYSSVYTLTYIPQVKPVVTLTNKTNGIRAEWQTVTGATKYAVYYKQSDAYYWKYKETTDLYFAFTDNIVIGTNYSFMVKPIFGTESGLYSAAKNLTYVPQVKPVVTLTNKSNGIRAEWQAVTGATKYIVYYRISEVSTWSSAETTNLYYALTGIKAGKLYYFQVKPVFDTLEGAYSAVRRLTYVPQVKPVVTLSNKSNGIRADWKAVSGATRYKVYYKKTGTSTWTTVITTSCVYTCTKAEKGINYSFQVQPVFENSYGLYSTVKSITFK